MPMMLLEVFIIPQIILKMLGESPPHFLPELTPDDFGLNRWVSCSRYMAVLNHSKYRKLSSPLQNTRVVQGMFTAAAWMTEPQEAVASSHLALPTKAAHEMCCAHMPCRYLAPFLTYHAGCPSSSTWRKALTLMPPHKHFLVMGVLIKGSYTIGVPWSYALQMYGNMQVAGAEKKTSEMKSSPAIPVSAECV